MSIGIIAAIAYGLLALVGGVMGYQKAKSKISLISGGISGVLLILAGILAFNGIDSGLILAAFISAVLIVVFTIRLVKTKKMMPAGLMIVTGLIALGGIGYQLSRF
ncbi:MAG: TMEM14 family protein [Microcoleaceae cyanobacterium]